MNQIDSFQTQLNLSEVIQSRLIGVNAFWAIVVISLTFLGIRSSYIFMVELLLSVLSSLVTVVLNYQKTARKWLLVHLFFQLITMLWATQFYHLFMKLFIPITGRIGGAKNPEYMIGTIAALCVLLIGSFIMPLIGLLKKTSELTSRLIVFTLIAFLLGCFTQVGFPYRDDSAKQPTVQRHYVTVCIRCCHRE